MQAVLAALAVGPPTRRGVRAAIAGIRVDAGASATGAVLAFAADGSAAVRAFSVLVARPPRLDVERTLVLPRVRSPARCGGLAAARLVG